MWLSVTAQRICAWNILYLCNKLIFLKCFVYFWIFPIIHIAAIDILDCFHRLLSLTILGCLFSIESFSFRSGPVSEVPAALPDPQHLCRNKVAPMILSWEGGEGKVWRGSLGCQFKRAGNIQTHERPCLQIKTRVDTWYWLGSPHEQAFWTMNACPMKETTFQIKKPTCYVTLLPFFI